VFARTFNRANFIRFYDNFRDVFGYRPTFKAKIQAMREE
jgi:hypothetical protein